MSAKCEHKNSQGSYVVNNFVDPADVTVEVFVQFSASRGVLRGVISPSLVRRCRRCTLTVLGVTTCATFSIVYCLLTHLEPISTSNPVTIMRQKNFGPSLEIPLYTIFSIFTTPQQHPNLPFLNMMFKITTLSILAIVLPTAFAQSESTAVRFKSFHSQLHCKLDQGDRHYMSDAFCYDLPLSRMDVTTVTDTCRSTFTLP